MSLSQIYYASVSVFLGGNKPSRTGNVRGECIATYDKHEDKEELEDLQQKVKNGVHKKLTVVCSLIHKQFYVVFNYGKAVALVAETMYKVKKVDIYTDLKSV